MGASLAGIARVEDLKSAPSFTFTPKMPYTGEGIGTPKSDLGLDPGEVLPGRDGRFSRPLCNIQMEVDEDEAREEDVEGFDRPVEIIKYCRRCELACPVGKPVDPAETV